MENSLPEGIVVNNSKVSLGPNPQQPDPQLPKELSYLYIYRFLCPHSTIYVGQCVYIIHFFNTVFSGCSKVAVVNNDIGNLV